MSISIKETRAFAQIVRDKLEARSGMLTKGDLWLANRLEEICSRGNPKWDSAKWRRACGLPAKKED